MAASACSSSPSARNVAGEKSESKTLVPTRSGRRFEPVLSCWLCHLPGAQRAQVLQVFRDVVPYLAESGCPRLQDCQSHQLKLQLYVVETSLP